MDKISIQEADFDLSYEVNLIRKSNHNIGAIVSFIGVVRDLDDKPITKMFLEHYPKMTKKSLQNIITQARMRWQLSKVTLIHRVGFLDINAQIVLVITSSRHRQSAFLACEFIIDYLKTQAPFWKKEYSEDSQYWVEGCEQDFEKIQQWKQREG